MATFMLVHGSSCGGWVWNKIAPTLRLAGNDVFTPTLSGVSDRSHLANCDIDLNTHATDVINLIINEDLSQVVLVGHSYAGMVITAVAEKIPERLSRVVYLDAYLPENGQSELDLWPKSMRREIMSDEIAKKGFRQPPTAEFLGVSDPRLAEWINVRLTPHPMACYTQPVQVTNPLSAALQHTFILCTAGPTTPVFSTFAQRAKNKGWQVNEMPTGHLVMFTMPVELAQLLQNLTSINLKAEYVTYTNL